MDSDTGEYTGFDLELAQAVCDMEGWELVKTPIEWASKDAELNNGTLIVFGMDLLLTVRKISMNGQIHM